MKGFKYSPLVSELEKVTDIVEIIKDYKNLIDSIKQ